VPITPSFNYDKTGPVDTQQPNEEAATESSRPFTNQRHYLTSTHQATSILCCIHLVSTTQQARRESATASVFTETVELMQSHNTQPAAKLRRSRCVDAGLGDHAGTVLVKHLQLSLLCCSPKGALIHLILVEYTLQTPWQSAVSHLS
jgi:hypothetical protein